MKNYWLQRKESKEGKVAQWDFNTALGDTIKEKYESLYVKVVEISNVINRQCCSGANWIVTSPEVASIFETTAAGFAPAPSETFTSDGNFLIAEGFAPEKK
jgi:hypothetical protein